MLTIHNSIPSSSTESQEIHRTIHKSSTALATGFVPKTPEDELALEIAMTLGDEANFALHRTLARRYSEDRLREALRRSMAVPAEQIRKSRGALFTYLVGHMEHGSNEQPEND